MGLKKRLKKKFGKVKDTVKVLAGKDTAGEAKAKEAAETAQAQVTQLQGETDPAKLLEQEMKDYEGIDAKMREHATADARRAGTYADTREFNTQLEGEAQARGRGLKAMSRERQNSLRAKLGLTALPEGTNV